MSALQTTNKAIEDLTCRLKAELGTGFNLCQVPTRRGQASYLLFLGKDPVAELRFGVELLTLVFRTHNDNYQIFYRDSPEQITRLIKSVLLPKGLTSDNLVWQD